MSMSPRKPPGGLVQTRVLYTSPQKFSGSKVVKPLHITTKQHYRRLDISGRAVETREALSLFLSSFFLSFSPPVFV